MSLIKGITVLLTVKEQTGTDPFGAPVYQETTVPVEDVLVAPSSSTEINDALTMYGKQAVYTLAIPKGDAHKWEDTLVTFFGNTWHTIGFAAGGIEDNIPLRWNAKITVERYG